MGVLVHGHHHRRWCLPCLLLPHVEENLCCGCHCWCARLLTSACITLILDHALIIVHGFAVIMLSFGLGKRVKVNTAILQSRHTCVCMAIWARLHHACTCIRTCTCTCVPGTQTLAEPIQCSWEQTRRPEQNLQCSAGSVSGLLGALIAWLVTCKATEGEINVDNLGANYPMLAGNVTALGLSTIVTAVLSFAFPQNFDWEAMRSGIRMIEADGTDALAETGEDSEEGLGKALRCVAHLQPRGCATVHVAHRQNAWC